METITLSSLLKEFHIESDDERILQGVSDHSKEIAKDWLFISRNQGVLANTYIKEALDKGAVVFCERDLPYPHVYKIEHLDQAIESIMLKCYGNMCDHLCVIGVSGTSGKTSLASIITQLLKLHEHNVMQIGTGFVQTNDIYITTHNTTPGSFQLARCFDYAKQQHITHIVMEVSSHAIDQKRIAYVRYDIILYTNITQDHLDYHLTKTHYRYTKFKLRNYLKKHGRIIYNADYDNMKDLMHLSYKSSISFGTKASHVMIEHVSLSDHDVSFSLQGYAIHAPLLGMMSVYNISAACIAMRLLHYSYETLQLDCEKLHTVKGRLEVFTFQGIYVWIDYAHTVDALKQLLLFANEVKQGRMITLIGCGGDRDKTKRSIMGDIAAEYSDIALFTSDNPRYERVCDILQEMSVHHHENVIFFENRFFAIKHAVKIAQKSDIIIIAGKGNEKFLSIKGKDYPFSDQSCVYKLFKEEEM